MKKRLLQKPVFHFSGIGVEKKVGWLELFYDLMYVASFIQLGNIFSRDISLYGFIKISLIFITFWVSWSGFSLFSNRYTIDDFLHRVLVFLHMFTVASLTVLAPRVFNGDYSYFTIIFGISQLLVALLYLRASIQTEFGSKYTKFWFGAFSLSGFTWLSAPFFPNNLTPLVWAVGVAIILITPILNKARNLFNEFPFDYEHLSERYSLLTIIVIGESFVKVLTELVERDSGMNLVIQACFSLLIACSIWWIYFDDVAESKLKKSLLAFPVWLVSHLPLQMGIVLMGVGIKKVVSSNMAHSLQLNDAYLLSFSIALILAFVGLIDLVTVGKSGEENSFIRVQLRFFISFICVLLGIFSQSMSALLFVSSILTLGLIQIIINIILDLRAKAAQ
ncbi:putative integral membrane protein [Halobacteriovorax marinus SJ]|uniref:Integral membrane protein n=1 Tax=Halobacteriovorax marinus (strain ATCC BAA-682 / DSM 15412 / SJ) TaxID=862908 RepID=E1WYA4_HALMS|nr:low temperature requirement protein A [Halobacteriovorax marinus]CBW25952.1 putative integral membrane protein [Halobacteriovorax marinus SJ]